MLAIAITKGTACDTIDVRLASGAVVSFAFPKKGPIPHDFVHLAAEEALELKRGFWGMVAEGAAPAEIQERAKAGGHASASRAQTPAPEIVELIQAERIVECFEADFWSAPADCETFRAVAAAACGQSFAPCPALSDELIAAVRARIAVFAKQWAAAPAGTRFELRWSAAA